MGTGLSGNSAAREGDLVRAVQRISLCHRTCVLQATPFLEPQGAVVEKVEPVGGDELICHLSSGDIVYALEVQLTEPGRACVPACERACVPWRPVRVRAHSGRHPCARASLGSVQACRGIRMM